ncbi:MAG: ABC transporter substrate-binding protein [Meiothermus sp.]|nr:ABC transporter substrate-binding protein [Meiothermus sp.]
MYARKMWKFGAVSLALLGASLAPALAQDFDPNATINLATNADPTLNPWTPGAVVESNLINTIVFDQLVRYSKKDLSPSPALATSWRAAPDGLSWIFNLRRDVTWHDGRPFTAEDVAFTFNDVILNRKLGAQNSATYSSISKVEVVNPFQVRFVLSAPFSSLPYYLASFAGIIPKHVLGSAENPLQVASFNKRSPVGTGAFRVAEFVPGSYVRLVRNERYWGGTPKVASIVFRIVPDPNTQVAQVISGELDAVVDVNPALLAGVERNNRLQILRQSENIYYFVALNQNDPRMRDVQVRQALLMALDRKAMIEAIIRGYGTTATGPIAPVLKALHVSDVPRFDYNPQRAQQLLRAAGWTPGPDGILQKDGKPFEIDMPTGQLGYLVPATLLVQQYWKAIGVKANVSVMEWNAYIQKMFVNRQYEATLAWWRTPPTPDVTPYYASSAADRGNNIPNYKNPDLDKLLEQGRAATDVQQQVLIYRRMQRLLAEQLPYLYLWYPNVITVRNQRLGGMPETNNSLAYQYAVEWFVRK